MKNCLFPSFLNFSFAFAFLFVSNASAQQRYWLVYDQWQNEGEAAYCKKDYAKCVTEYDKLIANYPKISSFEALANQAGCAVLAGDTTKAFANFNLMTRRGYKELFHITENPDFLSVKNTAGFQQFLTNISANEQRYAARYGVQLPAVRDELLKMYEESQKFQQWKFYKDNYKTEPYTKYSNEDLENFKKQTFKDQFSKLIDLVKQNDGSVFGKSKVGVDGAQIFIILVTNASHDVPTQTAFIEAMEQSEPGEFAMEDLAYLIDRRLKNNKQPQRYGTHIVMNGETKKPDQIIEVEDPANLNARRKNIGLEPLDETFYKH